MSGNQNQKQTVTGGPQTQRFQASPYPPISQTNNRADGYAVSTPPGNYVPQQPNQGANQGPGLRGLAPSGPPNQAPTPPNNADIKVQTLPQPTSMNMFVQAQVRSNQGSFYTRTAGPPSQTPRMPNHNNRVSPQQSLFGPQAQFVMSPMYLQAAGPVPYFNNGQRAPGGYVQSTIPPIYSQHIAFPYNTAPTPSPSYFYPNQTNMQRMAQIPQAQPTNPNPTQQTIQTLTMVPSAPQQQPFRQNKVRRPKAISIIDPDTGADRLNEIYEDNSHPPSGESSARQTPQPAPSHNKEVQAAFAKQVLQAIHKDENLRSHEPENHEPSGHQVSDHGHPVAVASGPAPVEHPCSQPPPHASNNRMEHLIQSSNLKVQAKEFFLPTSATKETTPVVSANCDAAEVTLPNKSKDRESPAKGRKQRDHKDQAPAKEPLVCEKSVKMEMAPPAEVKITEPPVPSAAIITSNATNLPPAFKDSNKENMGQDKKTQKKEPKLESKVASPGVQGDGNLEGANVVLPAAAFPHISSAQEISSAKPKQDVQRGPSKSGAGAAQTNTHKLPSASVPPPQPAKANKKSYKKIELNQKGANKEGTDMDAFNDVKDEPASVQATPVPGTEVKLPEKIDDQSSNTNVGVPNANSEIESNETKENVTIKTEPTTKFLKKTIDVTDIVKEKPKVIKSFTAIAHDETDKAAVSNNDKLVQAKNEVNAKVTESVENESKLNYKEGQWSPDNRSGQMVYDKQFLLALRDIPVSRKKPDNLPDVVLIDERARLSDGRQSMGGSSRPDFTPSFTNYGGGKSGSQRGAISKRGSQTGKLITVGNKGQKVSMKLLKDVKLHETKNAWKPARFNKGELATEDDSKTEDLYKKVRGVLNKLTPQKFETLLSQIKELRIDTEARLQGVIDLVFEKAVDEPNFSVAYALMCRELALMQVPTSSNTEEKPEFVNFRKLLINRCQVEFEKQSVDESVRNVKLKEIAECTDPEKNKDLQFDLEEYDRRLRMKSVGNIRFIGELFKQNMLTVNIMIRCLNNLLESKDEESLECLCKLLTTIGKELETKNVNLNHIFNTMKNLVDKKEGKVSSRIRFMLQDVIDLRNCKWVSRRQDLNPKTIDQIQKEADHEQMNIQMMNSVPMTPRKDDRGGSGPNSDRKSRRNVSDDGWIVNTRNRTQITVETQKLRSKAPQIDEPLGSSQMFGNWGKGSVGSNFKISQQSQLGPNTNNIYTALETVETEKRQIGSRDRHYGGKDPYMSKGPSMESGYNKYDGRNSRSGSQHRSNNGSSSSQRGAPVPSLPPTVKLAPVVKPPSMPAPAAQLTEEQMERRVNNSLDEYVTGNCSGEEFFQDVSAAVPVSYHPKMVEDCYLHVLEKSQPARLKTGSLFAKLIKQGLIKAEDYCVGLERLLEQAEDLRIDIPKFWDYLAELLMDLICNDALPVKRLHQSFEVLNQRYTSKVLAPLFKMVVSEKGPNFLQNVWQQSGLQLSHFMLADEVNSFIKENQFEFLMGGSTPFGQNQLPYEQIQSKLSELLRNKTSLDDTVNWITANVGDRTKENKFIRALATAIFEDSIGKNDKLIPEALVTHNNLLLKYVDNNVTYELQCLFALQALINKKEHPQGLLLSICDKLYEIGSFPQESFIVWETSNDPAEQEGKGVALKQLTSFFTQLKENDEDDYSTSDEA